ncbi:hypothetical protein DL95DRAFT_490499 [Leptodontidium sp. 2 PMI_412]|nr:hypothetical protein DL95DRAFT_490499 [Leptodontidium sp. 2 PMI_412]
MPLPFFYARATTFYEKLIYDLDLIVDLASVKNNLTNTRSGFSFIKHPNNGLVNAYLDLLIKAYTTRYKRLFRENRWDWEVIFSYYAKAKGLDEMLLGELFIIYLTRHHKAKRSNNREFYIMRFLPARLSRVIYKYFVYLRLFLNIL